MSNLFVFHELFTLNLISFLDSLDNLFKIFILKIKHGKDIVRKET